MTATRLGKGFNTPYLAKPLQSDTKPQEGAVRVLRGKGKALRSVRPNAGVAVAYQRKIEYLIDQMHRSANHWITDCYYRNEPRITHLAQDAAPADELTRVIRLLRRRWLRKFDRAAQELAKYFAKAVKDRNDAELKKILRKSGMVVDFQISQSIRDALKAIVAENVSLIKSIPEQYLGQVEGMVMRSVVAGGDLATLTKGLQKRYSITRKRAELIAHDQNSKATGKIQQLRYTEIGIEKAIWRHSHAGKVPRPTHVANDGKEFDVKKGWYDPDPKVKRHILTGELINCRCFFTPILPD